jgi:hypothetical protein
MSRSRGHRHALTLSLLLLASTTPGLAWSADNGIYVGGSFGDVSSDYAFGADHRAADDDRAFKAIVGARPLDWLAIEANYTDFGETRAALDVACPAIPGFPCPDRETVDARALSVSLLGMWALPLLDVYARVGTSRWETEHRVRFGNALKTEGTDPTYGVGLQGRVGSFALRVEYERFDFGRDDAELLSAGFTYTFL